MHDRVRKSALDPEVRCLVITGAGRAFSAGEDLAALAAEYEAGRPPDLGQILTQRYNPLIKEIRAAPKPVIAGLNGVAAGAGASVALACDLRIASERASLRFPFAEVGHLHHQPRRQSPVLHRRSARSARQRRAVLPPARSGAPAQWAEPRHGASGPSWSPPGPLRRHDRRRRRCTARQALTRAPQCVLGAACLSPWRRPVSLRRARRSQPPERRSSISHRASAGCGSCCPRAISCC